MSSPDPQQTTQLTVTLPAELVRDLDEQSEARGVSLDQTIRQLIETALSERVAKERRIEQQRRDLEQYERGWREQPLTEDEYGWVMSPSILKHLDEAPWESDEATSGGPISRHPGEDVPSS